MILKTATSILEYLKIIDEYSSKSFIWFRGQNNAEYQLEPSLYREKFDISIDEPYYKREMYIVKDDNFGVQKLKSYLESKPEYKDFTDLDYLYKMQHFDIPTRLLDFSSNALVALYFSVTGNKFSNNNFSMEEEINSFNSTGGFSNHGSSIYCINPMEVNRYSFGKNEIIDISNYNYSTMGNLDFPICINPKNIDLRMEAQSSKFVYFGKMIHPLDYYSIFENKFLKIFIPNSKREAIKNDLKENFEISHSTIYPDMKGYTLEVIDEMNLKFSKKRNEKL